MCRDVRFHPVVGFLNIDGTRRKGVVACEFAAWADLLMEANWRDREFAHDGKNVRIERGQLLGARSWLAARWGWSEDSVRWFLKKLEKAEMIELQSSKPAPKQEQASPQHGEHTETARAEHQASTRSNTQSNTRSKGYFANVITICNYNVYQAAKEIEDLLNTRSDAPTAQSQHQTNTGSTPDEHPHLKNLRREEGKKGEREVDRANAPNPNGAAPLDVVVNGVSIHGPGFNIPYSSIDVAASLLGLEVETARQVAEIQARSWVAEKKIPENSIALVTAAMRSFAEAEAKKKADAERKAQLAAKRAEQETKQGTLLPEDWVLNHKWGQWAVDKHGLTREQVIGIAESFKRYWHSPDAKRKRKLDWKSTWENWVDKAVARNEVPRQMRIPAVDLARPEDTPEPIWQEMLSDWVKTKRVSRQDAVAAGWMGSSR